MKPSRYHLLLLVLLLVTGPSPAAAASMPWTLERAIAWATTNSPDARIAQRRIAAARAGIEQADSGLWPHLELRSGYTRTDNPMLVFGSILNQRSFRSSLNFNDVPDTDDLNVRGVLTQPLYTGGRLSASRRAARATTAAAQASAEAVRHTLAFEVVRGFHTILKTRDFIGAAQAARDAYASNLLMASNRLETGNALRTDVLDLQVRLAQAREELLRARNANALAERALRTLLGLDAGEFLVADSAPTVAAPEESDFSGRPELSAVREQQRAAAAQLRLAKAGFRPRVNAFGSLDYDRGWRTDGDGRSYTAGVLVQWDIWDGQQTRGRVSEAQANLEAAGEEERKLQLAIGLEVEQARLQFQESTERLAVATAAIRLAEESAELTRARFEQGLAIAVQIIDAESALTAARVRRAEAEADQRIAIAAVRRALGLPQLTHLP